MQGRAWRFCVAGVLGHFYYGEEVGVGSRVRGQGKEDERREDVRERRRYWKRGREIHEGEVDAEGGIKCR